MHFLCTHRLENSILVLDMNSKKILHDLGSQNLVLFTPYQYTRYNRKVTKQDEVSKSDSETSSAAKRALKEKGVKSRFRII